MKTSKKNMMLLEYHNPKIIIVKPINNNNIKTLGNINLPLSTDKIKTISKLIGFIY